MKTPRQPIATCYDHLSGIAGEILSHRLVELGWVTPEPTPGVTPQGWKGFADLGLNLTPLTTGRRKPVAFCTEIRGRGEYHEHLGGHLGGLIRQHFLERGWLALADGKLTITPAGEQVLEQLGVHLEVQA
ncbi:MAG TPA: hypothetical protein VK464_27220 [Symbiobacteriaceae bacterium]|jgi:hypothetical protein|nr:hypothetical protein [Symbiobacteriaceae bacterium]